MRSRHQIISRRNMQLNWRPGVFFPLRAMGTLGEVFGMPICVPRTTPCLFSMHHVFKCNTRQHHPTPHVSYHRPYQKCVFRQGFCGWQHVYYMISRYFPMFALPPSISNMGVSKNRDTPKWMVKIMEIPWNPYKNGMMCRYHYFRKPPYINNQFNIYIYRYITSPWGHANFSRQHPRWWEQRIVRKAIPQKNEPRHWRLGNCLVSGPQTCFFWWKFKLSSFLDYFDFHFYSSINKFWSGYGFMFTQMCFDIQTVLRRLKDGWHPKT